MPRAFPAIFAQNVDWTRLPPVPYRVFKTSSKDSLEISQNIKKIFKEKDKLKNYRKWKKAWLLQAFLY